LSIMIEASAPGKVVLSGEYAVLHGAPAVCMAVDRRARVTVTEGSGDFHVVTAPGYVEGTHQFLVRDGVFGWVDSSADFELLEHVWRASGIDRIGGLELRLDTSEFLDPERGCKTGIGSSAALSVALAYALDAVESGSRSPLDAAHQGHLDFQGGLGSGVDIATSDAGGLVLYRMDDRSVAGLAVPRGLECRLFWSGTPASTGKKLEKISSHGPQPSQDALVYSAKRMAEAWGSGSAQAVLGTCREYIRVLQEFSDDHGLGIFDAGHAELTSLAENAGLVYKPCGAGGGDIGILLADDPHAADAFVAASLPDTFRPLDLQFDPEGADVTRAVP
jgi:phosphomevalonate kinase